MASYYKDYSRNNENNILGLKSDSIDQVIDKTTDIKSIKRKDFFKIVDYFGLNGDRIIDSLLESENYDKSRAKIKNLTNSSDKDQYLSKPETIIFKDIIRNIVINLLRNRIKAYIKYVSGEIDAEIITIWLYRKRINSNILNEKKTESEIILLNETQYIKRPQVPGSLLDSIGSDESFEGIRDDIRKFPEGNQRSLTAYPFKVNYPVNLQGAEITSSKAKRFRAHRSADYLRSGKIESLLRIAHTEKGEIEEENRYYCMISFENKIDDHERVILSEIGVDEKGKLTNIDEKRIFSKRDESVAQLVIDSFFDELKYYMLIGLHDDIPVCSCDEKSDKVNIDYIDWMQFIEDDLIGSVPSNRGEGLLDKETELSLNKKVDLFKE